MRVTVKGQITIPKAIRKKYGILPGSEVDLEENGRGEVVLKKCASRSPVDRIYGILRDRTSVRETDPFIERLRGRM